MTEENTKSTNILLEKLPNEATYMAMNRFKTHLLDHHKIMVSLSGGSDSDTMLDIIYRVLQEREYSNVDIHYIFFDTGIEYEATKRHIDELEEKYGIKIERIRSTVPVPLGCMKFGLPFLSKYCSQMISRLQRYNFDFKKDGNKSYEELIQLYPKCKGALKFWCNIWDKKPDRYKNKSYFEIDRFNFLKEFMIENPPDFKISDLCCKGAKKEPSEKYIKENDIDLKLLGLRQAEGGVRSAAIKSCYSQYEDDADVFRPIWWFKDKDKKQYKDFFKLNYSDCYEKWGFKRTGCAGCPFGSNFEEELVEIQKYEPKLYNAIVNIFGKSYEYTRKYREFKKQKQSKIGLKVKWLNF